MALGSSGYLAAVPPAPRARRGVRGAHICDSPAANHAPLVPCVTAAPQAAWVGRRPRPPLLHAPAAASCAATSVSLSWGRRPHGLRPGPSRAASWLHGLHGANPRTPCAPRARRGKLHSSECELALGLPAAQLAPLVLPLTATQHKPRQLAPAAPGRAHAPAPTRNSKKKPSAWLKVKPVCRPRTVKTHTCVLQTPDSPFLGATCHCNSAPPGSKESLGRGALFVAVCVLRQGPH